MRFSTNLLLPLLGLNSAVVAKPAGPVPSGNTPVTYKVQTPPLSTKWTNTVGTNPWKEHPRPKLQRKNWKSLNGIWTYKNASGPTEVETVPTGPLEKEIMVPSCIEYALSGIQGSFAIYSWFSTSFTVSPDWKGQSVLLNFEAVDYEATVFINGQKAGFNRGGYWGFTVDATKLVKFDAENTLQVFVFDPTDMEGTNIPVGKQSLYPSHIFYRPCSGIWQSVWLESAPADHIAALDVSADMHGKVNITAHSSSNNASDVEVSVIDRKSGKVVGSGKGKPNKAFDFTVKNPKLWSPEEANLYNLKIKMGSDEITSYTGFRTLSKGKVRGVTRPLLNGEFIFAFGTLDQGFWPDGGYLPPSNEAMVYDLLLLKKLGMNMVRKHIKVEPALFYKACDEHGLLVFQDMPSMFVDSRARPPTPEQQAEFERQLTVHIKQLRSHTCIATWVIYNEGWGQLPNAPEQHLTDLVRQLDPTRLIDATTGWNDNGFGDYSDNHHYANPQCGTPFYSTASSPYDPSRIGFQGEFGGLGHNVSIENLWNDQKAINAINQTYELNADLDSYNYRAHTVLKELYEQTQKYSCSGGVYTQTTDVEGEVNGLMTYDRKIIRPNVGKWQEDIKKLYQAAESRGGRKVD